MSYGAIRFEEGAYLPLHGGAEPVTAADFEKPEYITPLKLLTENLKLSGSDITELNRIIGRFLAIIQEASFIHRSVLKVIPPDYWSAPYMCGKGMDMVYPHEPLTYVSTLPPDVLAAAVRQNVARVVEDTLALMPAIKKDARDCAQKTADKKVSRSATLAFTADASHEDSMRGVTLLSAEACLMIDRLGLGNGFITALNEILQNFMQSVLARADLSFVSFRRDITNLERVKDDPARSGKKQKNADVKPLFPPNAEYSTLNPNDLMEMSKRYLCNMPAAIFMSMADEIKNPIINADVTETLMPAILLGLVEFTGPVGKPEQEAAGKILKVLQSRKAFERYFPGGATDEAWEKAQKRRPYWKKIAAGEMPSK